MTELFFFAILLPMKIASSKKSLSGTISVPGSKSHTIRACIFASLAEGTSYIRNPLPSADGLSATKAIQEIGAQVTIKDDCWEVIGAGKNIHLPANVVDVGNSGSVLYFLSPICATFSGWSIFTGDESIRTRPVKHLIGALEQLHCEAYVANPQKDAPPLLIKGPICPEEITTDGRLSQYISGLMIASTKIKGKLTINLTDPKEVPYLDMTKGWLESFGIPVSMSSDYKKIEMTGPFEIKAFDRTIPSDWEAVAFPLIAALISDSCVTITNIDFSGSQGDDAIVDVLKNMGATISLDTEKLTLTAKKSRLSGNHTINCAGFPDAVPALAVIACFNEGTTRIEDIGVCRRKETDRIEVMKSELTKLGAEVEDGEDFLVIHGHAPLTQEGTKNPDFKLHGGTVESFHDHRVAMALACMGLGLDKEEEIIINDAECCAVSFPNFFEAMNGIGAEFKQVN